MQKLKQTLTTGSLIHGRYLIKDILGTGGFSAVYLVQDLQEESTAGPGKLFALKQLTERDKQERERFTFEGEVLMRLQHPALPRIHRVFEDEEPNRACILMDYVEGPNLEVLRRRQFQRCLPLSQVMTIMQPIVDAIAYLHCQLPPIIHRDVKPANIIVPSGGTSAVLVDFGIAKEYSPDSTTTAIRHCSPGYGAPEQYSSGTGLRTDIYGLGATFYALLSGIVPVDALRRATELASSKRDPLVPVQELSPSIPSHVAQAIGRAMSISSDKRYSTVEDFWQALHDPVQQGLLEPAAHTDAPRLDAASSATSQDDDLPLSSVARRPPAPRSGKLSMLALLICALLIVVSAGLALWAYGGTRHGPGIVTTIAAQLHTPSTMPIKPSLAGSTPGAFPRLLSSYNGTMYNLLTYVSVKVYVSQLQQNNENFHGYMTGGAMQGALTGVLDTSKHIFFTLTTQKGSLFFEGAVRSRDGNIAGNYCNEDMEGQCFGDYGVWSIAPVH